MHLTKIYNVLFILLFTLSRTNANDNLNRKIDSLIYIQRTDSLILINLVLAQPRQFIGVKDFDLVRAYAGDRFDFVSNTPNMLGLDFCYKQYVISGLLRLPGYTYPVSEYGRTRFRRLILRINNDKFISQIHYNTFFGMVDRSADLNNQDLIRNQIGAVRMRSDMSVSQLKLKSIFYLNPEKFSYKAAFFGNQRQLKSGLSVGLQGVLHRTTNHSELGFAPDSAIFIANNFKNIKDIVVIGGAFLPGVSATVIVRRFFFTFQFYGGAEVQYQELFYLDRKPSEQKVVLAPQSETSFMVGFNLKKHHIALISEWDVNRFRVDDIEIINAAQLFLLKYGFKIEAPKWIKKGYTTIENLKMRGKALMR